MLKRVLKGEDDDADDENSFIEKYGKQIIEMNLDQILTGAENAVNVLTLTRVLVEIDPRIAIKKVKVINVILVRKFKY